MIVLDVEASGMEPHKHSLVSIGALDFNNPGNTFYAECRIWDGAHVSEEALQVNGFSEGQIRDPRKKSDGEIVKEFLAWASALPEHTIAGQNPSFDRDFIKATCERYHLDYPLAHRTIDVHTAAYVHMVKWGIEPPVEHKRSALNSTAIQNYVGIPEEPKPHNALNGAKVAAEALSRILYDKKLLPEFKQFDIPWLAR